MRRASGLRASACSLLTGAAFGLGAAGAHQLPLPVPNPAEAAASPLTAGNRLERETAPGETHRYTIELQAGQYLQLLVEQRGADVHQTLEGPDGSIVLKTDSPCQFIGPDPLAIVARQTGRHELSLKIDAVATPPRGRYELQVEAIREPSPSDLARVRAVQATAEGWPLFRSDPRLALDRYRTALQAWEEVGDRRMQMWTELVVGVLLAQGSDDFRAALERYRRPLATALELGDEWAEARVRYNIGQSLRLSGELEEGRANLERALELNRAAGRDDATARVLSSLGNHFAVVGEPQRSLDALFEALSLFQALGNTRSEAVTRSTIGTTYLRLRDGELALEQYQIALPAFAQEPARRASTIAVMAKAHAQMGDFARAREAYAEALTLHKSLDSPIYEADAYLGIGEVHQEEGDLRAAGELYASALSLYRSRGGYPLGEGMGQCRVAEVQRQLGDLGAARAAFEAALAVATKAGPLVSACAEAGLARVARDAGELEPARAHAESALARAESIRARVVSHHTRATTLASQQSLYEVMIDILMRQHAADPSAGRDVAAFEVSERARTRSLLELLAEGQVDVRRGVDPELLAEERSLRRNLNAKAQEEAQALAAGQTQRTEALGREADSVLARLAETEARIRRGSPQYAALTQPQPLTLAEIRGQVLDAETQLLQYTLGETRSHLWVVSAARLDSFPLSAPRRSSAPSATCAHACRGPRPSPAAPASSTRAKRLCAS